MKSFEIKFQPLMISAVLLLLVVGLAPQSSLAQTVSASPVYLTFGIPTGTSPAVSAAETVTVNITGTAGAVVSFTSFTLSPSSPFMITGNSCLNPPANSFTVPTACQISITLTTASTTLVTDTLVISYGGESSLSVPLSGAYGAIKLFDATTIAVSNTAASFATPTTIAYSAQNLSCPASPTATLSNSPDGLGYVLVDNYLVMNVGGSVSNTVSPAGNVCTGGVQDGFYDPNTLLSVQQDCFSPAYRTAAIANTLLGDNTDTLTNPGNNVLPNGAAGGVLPIIVGSFLPSNSTPPLQTSFTLLDAGGYVASSSLFLVTNCSPAGIAPGGSTTGNPTPTNTVSFDSNPGADLSITDNTAQNPPTTSGTTPIYTQIAVPQQLFYQLVAGTSAAPDVCLRASSELDYSPTLLSPPAKPAPMCVGILIQCYNPADGTTNGNNCDSSTPMGLRDLYDTVQFASPDAPVNGNNFLINSSPNACSYYLSNPNNITGGSVPAGSCATGTGPAVVMGGDNWLCAPGSEPTSATSEPTCTPLEPTNTPTPLLPEFNTLTPAADGVYTETNRALTGGLWTDLSPADGLTQFLGAADGSGGSSVPLKNSVLFLVANHPLPTAKAIIAGQNANGWINNTTATINATFSSLAASYPSNPSSTNNPPSNNFMPAPVYSLTYGISTWPTLPDTTYPVTTDNTNYNAGVPPYLGATGSGWLPLCPSGTATSFTSYATSDGTPSGTPTLTGLSNGIYNVHYFTTDCALTEGLVFNPTNLSNPTTNWASFPFTTVGVDTVAPTFSPSSCSPASSSGWYGKNITVSCSVNDTYLLNQYGSGFGALVNGIQGSASTQVSVYTNVLAGTATTAATAGAATGSFPIGTGTTPAPAAVSDLAGNALVGGVSAGPYQIDLQAPTITGPTLSAGPYYVNQPITVSFSCSDGAGSGVFSCVGTGGVLSLGTITPAATGNYTFTVNATDNVGNQATPSLVNYMVVLEPQTITFGALSNQVYGNPPFAVSASASSGLPVSFSASPASVCSVSGTTVTLAGVGVCTITASQSGNAIYAAATPVARAFSVTAPPWTITPASWYFGQFYPGQGASKTFTIHNPGTTSVAISLSIPGSNTDSNPQPAGDPDDFRITSSGCGKTLAGGASCNVTVYFAADSDDPILPNGNYAYLTVTSSGTILVQALMTAKVINPRVSLSTNSLSFGTVATGTTSAAKKVTLTNSGTGITPLTFGTISISPNYALAPGTTCVNGGNIAAGASCYIYVTFKPVSGSSDPGSVTITDNAPSGTQTISLSGK